MNNLLMHFYIHACVMNISPVAVGGDRFGAWLTKSYPGNWELLVKKVEANNRAPQTYDIIYTSDKYPDSKFVWSSAKKKYTSDRGISPWGI